MSTSALFIDCRKSHLRTFCCQIHQRAKIGGGGHHFYDDIINLGWCFLISIKRKFGMLQTSPLPFFGNTMKLKAPGHITPPLYCY